MHLPRDPHTAQPQTMNPLSSRGEREKENLRVLVLLYLLDHTPPKSRITTSSPSFHHPPDPHPVICKRKKKEERAVYTPTLAPNHAIPYIEALHLAFHATTRTHAQTKEHPSSAPSNAKPTNLHPFFPPFPTVFFFSLTIYHPLCTALVQGLCATSVGRAG